jgi:hypothetical protein
MDFLRRLAPLSHHDTTRAVAALPSRFAGSVALAVTNRGADQPARPGEDLLSPALVSPASGTTSAAEPVRPDWPMRAALRHGDVPPPVANTAAPIDDGRLRPANEGVEFPQHAAPDPASAPALLVDRAPAQARLSEANASVPDRDEFDAWDADRRTGTVRFARSAHAPAGFTGTDLRGFAAPVTWADAIAPLSAASVAHRRRQPADDGQVVHVTIGRIDVVAVAAPPPARRAAAPLPARATLADYLRGGRGGRR